MTSPDPRTRVLQSHRPPGWDELTIPDPPKPEQPPGMAPTRVHLAVAGLVLAAVWFGWALGRAWG